MRFVLVPGETVPLSNLLQWVTSRDMETTWEVRIREYKDNRSDAQNRLQWMWHGEYAKHFGVTKDQAYNRFKYRFCLPIMLADTDPKFDHLRYVWGLVRDDKEGKAAVVRLIHTGDLNTAQMAEAMTEYDRETATRGLAFPDPDELRMRAMAL